MTPIISITAGFVRRTVMGMPVMDRMFNIIFIFQLLIILTGLFCLRKGKPVLLSLILLNLLLGAINDHVIVPNCNRWWAISRNTFYNLFSLIDITIWTWVYYRISDDRKWLQKMVLVGWVVVMVSSVIEFWLQGLSQHFHFRSYMVFCILSVIYACIYLIRVLKKSYHRPTHDPLLWLCAGSIFFNGLFFLNLATMINQSYWGQERAQEAFLLLQSIAVITYYTFICIAFITYFYSSHRELSRVL